MKIGYSVEGSTDRAVLNGLKDRWCPGAELVEGRFRGSTQTSLRREIPRICAELFVKSCQVIVLLTDANGQPFREVKRNQVDRVPLEFRGSTIVGVADRNIECWLCADSDWLSKRTGRPAEDFRCDNPKDAFDTVLQVSWRNRQETAIKEIVAEAPMKRWLAESKSFETFYEDVWAMSKSAGCEVPNER